MLPCLQGRGCSSLQAMGHGPHKARAVACSCLPMMSEGQSQSSGVADANAHTQRVRSVAQWLCPAALNQAAKFSPLPVSIRVVLPAVLTGVWQDAVLLSHYRRCAGSKADSQLLL